MEFVYLEKYVEIKNGKIGLYKNIKDMEPVVLTHDLHLADVDGNSEYATKLGQEGHAVVKVRRLPPVEKYLNREDFPRRVLCEMTSICNFFCVMCPQQTLTRAKMHMDAELYKKVIDQIDERGVEGLWLYHFGESLLHPNFKEILEYVKTKNNLGVIWLSTNGYLMDTKMAEIILNSNIDYLNYSANAVTKKVFGTVADEEKFDKVYDNLENLIKLKNASAKEIRKPFIRVQMINQETTKEEIDAFIERYIKRVDIVSINMLEHLEINNNKYGLEQRERKELKHCSRVEKSDCFVNSDSTVTLCDAAYNGQIKIGNVEEQSLYDIWNSEERKRVLRLNKEGRMNEIEFCSQCADYDI